MHSDIRNMFISLITHTIARKQQIGTLKYRFAINNTRSTTLIITLIISNHVLFCVTEYDVYINLTL